MRQRTVEMLTKAHAIIQEGIPIRGKELAKLCGMKPSAGCRLVRLLREGGVGIQPTKIGYVMPDNATIKDDLYVLRKVNGRRAADFLMLQGIVGEMKKRMIGTFGEQKYNQIVGPLMPQSESLSVSLKLITEKSESLGI